MSERDELLASIAATTSDYREGAVDRPTPQHVDRWVNQFDDAVQLPILREMDHVLKKTYFSRKDTLIFLEGLFKIGWRRPVQVLERSQVPRHTTRRSQPNRDAGAD